MRVVVFWDEQWTFEELVQVGATNATPRYFDAGSAWQQWLLGDVFNSDVFLVVVPCCFHSSSPSIGLLHTIACGIKHEITTRNWDFCP